MGFTIAIAGKGGTGKTTIASLLVRLLREKKKGSILVVDADPNSNLADALGVGTEGSIGEILDEVGEHPEKIPVSMPKERFIEYQIQRFISEADGFDVLTMGKPEGPGCYCYVNNVLRNVMSKLIRDYDYIIIDNEAGLEHLSRRTTREADVLLAVSDATAVGLRSVKRIAGLVKELKISAKKKLLLVNRLDRDIEKDRVSGLGLDYIGNIPLDSEVARISVKGSSLLGLKKTAKSLKALERIGEKIWS